jgi:nicotinamide-nucleotide amidase
MLYHTDELNVIREELLKRKKTLAVAESVTSGHLQAAFSSATDASKFFQGGLTAYNAGQKCRHLHIEPIYAQESNCVSEEVATAMALATHDLFLTHVGLGITGYAAPVPELDIYHLFAYFAISFEGKIIASKKITSEKKNSVDVQVDYANQVIDALAGCLASLPLNQESVTTHP